MKKKRQSGRKVIIITLVVLILFITVVRLWLPYFLKDKVNNTLSTRIKGYHGTIEDLDLFVLAGSYTIDNLKVSKTTGRIPVPFFTAEKIDLSIEWGALLKGELVGEVQVQRPQLNFVKGPTEISSQIKIDHSWKQVVNDLLPLRVNRFEVNQGEIHFHDFHSQPPVDLQMDSVHLLASNLTNADNEEKSLPSTVEGSAKVYEGILKVNMHINPLQKTPTFDMHAELTGINLQHLNDFFKAYGNFDVKKGNFSLYTDAATRNNKIHGLAKPVVEDIDVVTWKNNEGITKLTTWENGTDSIWAFKDQRNDVSAKQVEFERNLNKTDADLFGIIGETMQNAFMKVLMPSLRNSMTVATPNKIPRRPVVQSTKPKAVEEKKEGFFKRLFKKKDDKERRKKKKDNNK